MKKLYYLASPFSHSDPKVMRERTEKAIDATIALLNKNMVVFSPIAYNGHWVDKGIPGDWNFWKNFDELIISRCDALIVLQLEGWDKSVGIAAEIEHARSLDIPVYYVTQGEISEESWTTESLRTCD